MYTSPYETQVCRAYNLSSIEKALKLAQLEGRLLQVQLRGRPVPGLLLLSPTDRETPAFAHPIFMEGNEAVLDARGLIRKDPNADYAVANHTEYEFLVLRSLLTRYARINGGEDLAVIGDLPLTVFARYLSERIVRTLGLNPEEQAQITMVSAFYYLCLLRDAGEELSEQQIQKMVTKVSRVTHLPAEWMLKHSEGITMMSSLAQYVDVVKKMIDSSRIQNLSVPFLISAVKQAWWGPNAQEVMGVALEHPPTFIAMIYTAVNDRSFRNAALAKVTLANDKRDAGRELTRNVVQLIGVKDV